MNKPVFAPCSRETLLAASALQNGLFYQSPKSPQHVCLDHVNPALALAEDQAEAFVRFAVCPKPLDEVVGERHRP